MKAFLKKKDIEISGKRYFIDALSAMAQGLFASLIIGLIIKTMGEQLANLIGENALSGFFVSVGTAAMGLMGAAIGVAVSLGLKAPLLVVVCGAITGTMGATAGGPAGSFVAAVFGCEFGKLVSKETKVDILVTPAVTLCIGMLAAKLIGPGVSALMKGLGVLIMKATEMQPFFYGIIVSVIVGLALTAPISSAALAIMLELSGPAAGAATVGCCAQMIGFAVISYRENGFGGAIAQGLGTSMLQVPNIVRNWRILIPPTLAGAILGPISTCIFHMTNNPSGAGMGTSGLVGQIGTLTDMGFTLPVFGSILLLHIVLPAVLSYLIYLPLRRMGWIKDGDMKLDM